jgi:hypothetical protein
VKSTSRIELLISISIGATKPITARNDHYLPVTTSDSSPPTMPSRITHATGRTDISVIALWLGHASIQTTQVYLHAHIGLKVAALAKLKPLDLQKATHFQPEDQLLAFLDGL